MKLSFRPAGPPVAIFSGPFGLAKPPACQSCKVPISKLSTCPATIAANAGEPKVPIVRHSTRAETRNFDIGRGLSKM
jgi:hypothetical protein